VRSILSYLNVAVPAGMSIAPPRLSKLADQVSAQWAARYRELKWPPRARRHTTVRSYFICTGPRTGGFLLAEALESTNVAGRPREYCDPVIQRDWCAANSIRSDAEYYERVLEAGTTSNGVFGAKVLWHQFVHLLDRLRVIEGLGVPALELLRLTFPELRYVLLTRRDKVRQAISYDRAIRSGVWWSIGAHADGNGEAPARTGPTAPTFDFNLIDDWVTRLTEFDANWRCHFRRIGVAPFEVVYEDLVDNLESTVLEIIRYLDLPTSTQIRAAQPRFQKLADDITDECVRRYQDLKATRQSRDEPPARASVAASVCARPRGKTQDG
jgi:LPS sulfotransferase NodH